MATVGLRDLHYAKITNDADTGTEYGEIKKIAGAITANMSTAYNTANLRADDGVVATAEAKGVTTVTLNTSDLSKAVKADLLGQTINEDGVLIEGDHDVAPYVAIGWRSEKANGEFRYVWLYKGKFHLPEENYETKQETPAFQTPTLNGQFIARQSDKERKAEVDSDDEEISQSVIDNWFNAVYEGSTNGGGGVEG